MRGASLSSFSVISCDSDRASLRTVNERTFGDLLLLCAILSSYRLLVNTQIFSYAFRRCNKRMLSPPCFPTRINPTCSRNQHGGDGIQSI
nr:MAG TPA: hypothetical protein [Caudoviricetes sp.]